MISKYPSRRRRVLSIAAWILLVILALLYIGLPAAMGVVTLLPARGEVGQPPQGFEEVTLQTQDGVQLAAWYQPPTNGSAILLLPGAGGSREALRPYAELLARNGYGVLALDPRGHGESQGKTNRLGWQGTLDVGAGVDFLDGRGEVQSIGGLGISMGGEILLGAAAQYPVIGAIAADGATRRSTEELLALESERPLVRNFTARVMYATVRLLSGERPPQPLLDSMIEAEATRFLFIAAGGNQMETEFNQMFAATLGERAALWIAPETAHTQALSLFPEEYAQRLIEFYDAALSAPGS